MFDDGRIIERWPPGKLDPIPANPVDAFPRLGVVTGYLLLQERPVGGPNIVYLLRRSESLDDSVAAYSEVLEKMVDVISCTFHVGCPLKAFFQPRQGSDHRLERGLRPAQMYHRLAHGAPAQAGGDD